MEAKGNFDHKNRRKGITMENYGALSIGDGNVALKSPKAENLNFFSIYIWIEIPLMQNAADPKVTSSNLVWGGTRPIRLVDTPLDF